MKQNNENIEKNPENNLHQDAPKKDENPNKITLFEIFVTILLVICIALYVSPNFLTKLENRKNAQIQTNVSIFASKALSEFSITDQKLKATAISKKLAEELNAVNKNPYNKKLPAYSINEKCDGCVIITPDDKLNSITIEAYTNDNILLARTILQPPSFVTYTRDLTELEKPEKKQKEEKNEQ